MAIYGIPDITGTNSNYLNVNIPQFVYRQNFYNKFEKSPVFADSIVIRLVNEGVTLTQGIDWDYNSQDIDHNAMGRAYLESPAFNKILINGITFSSTRCVGKTVSMQYQEFYRSVPGSITTDGTPLEMNPELIKYLIDGLANTRQQVSGVTSPLVSNFVAPSNLQFDLNGDNPDNAIVNEKVTINTVAGAKVIRLSQGAFFGNSLTIRQGSDTLNPQADYSPIVTSPLTARTTNVGGIYHYLLINKEVVGDIYVDYHAVGGDVQPSDIESVYSLMVGIRDYLSTGKLLTTDSIPLTPAFQAINDRLQKVESDMRTLLTGTPTYGDSTSGDMAKRVLRAADTNFHWWTIAKLYQVAGSTDVVTADRFKGRVFFAGSNVALTFTADVNLNVSRNAVSFSTESVVFDPLYDLFNSISVNSPVYPIARVIWNSDGNAFSGAFLQIGMILKNLTDTVIIEDLSTTESCWLLDKTGVAVGTTPAAPNDPSDNNVTLPDGSSVWATGSGISYSQTYVPKFDKGYLVYAGDGVTLTTLNTTASTTSSFNSALPNFMPIANFSQIVVTMQSSDSSKTYDVVIPITGVSNSVRSGSTSFKTSTGQVVGISATLSSVLNSNSTISINVDDLTAYQAAGDSHSSLLDRVRYIRAKV